MLVRDGGLTSGSHGYRLNKTDWVLSWVLQLRSDRVLTYQDMQHYLWYMTLDDKLFLAPIKENPKYVLDIGIGIGIWAIDFGENCSAPC